MHACTHACADAKPYACADAESHTAYTRTHAESDAESNTGECGEWDL